MQARQINQGDRVKCDVKGRRFTARVISKAGGTVWIDPDSRQVTNRAISSRQVKERLS